MTAALPVILAGGLGTRLGPLAAGLPKPMVDVGGQPFLEHLVRQLAAQGFPELLLLVGHRAEAIQAHFGDGAGWGIGIRYSRESAPLGTGGALKLAAPLLPERFLLLFGDLFRPADYLAIQAARTRACLAVYPYVPGLTTIACANVALDPSGGRVARYVKGDPASGCTHVDAGFGVFPRRVLDLLPEGPCSFEALVYPRLCEAGELDAVHVDRNFLDIGNPVDLARARAYFDGTE